MLSQNNLIDKFSNILPKIESESDIYFENFSMGGLEEMHQYSKDERLYEFFEFDPFRKIDDTKAYIEKLLHRMSGQSGEKNAMYWFVRRKSDNRLIGTAALTNLIYERQSVEQGYGTDPELWGNGYILQIKEILKHFTFEVLKLNRLSGITMRLNNRTIQSVMASGMQHEGTLVDFYCKDGIYIDGWQYGMIAKDYYGVNTIAPSVSVSINNIIDVVSSVLTEDVITVESSMENTFSWDSLNHMAIMVALKSRLSIDLNPGEIAHMTTIQNIYNQIHGIK